MATITVPRVFGGTLIITYTPGAPPAPKQYKAAFASHNTYSVAFASHNTDKVAFAPRDRYKVAFASRKMNKVSFASVGKYKCTFPGAIPESYLTLPSNRLPRAPIPISPRKHH